MADTFKMSKNIKKLLSSFSELKKSLSFQVLHTWKQKINLKYKTQQKEMDLNFIFFGTTSKSSTFK
jgi:hypothetical protein